MACSVASTCYLFTRCKWSSRWSNVLPTSVGVVIGLKDNTQTGRHRQTQADTQWAAGKYRDIITASICNALCSSQFDLLHCWHIAGNIVVNLLTLLVHATVAVTQKQQRYNELWSQWQEFTGLLACLAWYLLVFDILRLSTLQSITPYAITLPHFIFHPRLLRCQFRVRKHTSIV